MSTKYRLKSNPSVTCVATEVVRDRAPGCHGEPWMRVEFSDVTLRRFMFEVPLSYFALTWEPVPTLRERITVLPADILFRDRRVYLGVYSHCSGMRYDESDDESTRVAFGRRVMDMVDEQWVVDRILTP